MIVSEILSAEFWFRWIKIVILDLSLAGDNALVIALAVRNLPARQQWQGRLWGTVGAVGLRVLFIGVLSFLLDLPFLRLAGGVVLLWIAVKLLAQEGGEEGETSAVRQGTTLVEAIRIIIVADVIMSLDNVLAVAGAAHGDLLLVVFGVGLSIPIVIGGSGLLTRLMGRFPWLVDLGAGILGWVGGEMILEERAVRAWTGSGGKAMRWAVQGALAVGVIAVGRLWVSGRAARAERRAASR